MIDNVVAALGLGLNLTDEEIADVLWLAVQMQQFGDGVISEQGDRNEALENSVSNRESPKQPAQPLRDADRNRQDENKEDEQNFEVHSKNTQGDDLSTRRSDELQLKIPDARSLQKPLELARSLRPLMRRVPSQVNTLLDEEATVRRIAEEKIWCPVLRPALEPWLDLALVIDDSASMLMWRHTIAELQHFLSSYGVFRDVRVWRLGTDNAEKVCIYAGATASDRNGSPRSPSELIEANGRGLVLVVSDCIAPIWRNGAIAPALQVWSRSGMVAILQMLPDWLWARTALGRGVAAQFSALAAGIPNYQLTTTTVSTWYDIDLATSIKIPVVTLEPEKFTAWAEMLAGNGGAWSAGIVFEPELFAVPEVAIELDGASELGAEDRLRRFLATALPIKMRLTGLLAAAPVISLQMVRILQSAEERVQSFRLTASPIARRLAGLLAAAPVISLPIVRILQSKVLTQSQPVHVAEVFLGGLLKPLSEITAKTNPNYVQYDFIEGVRDLLLESVPSSEIVNIVAVVSEYIAERLGISLEEFGAIIRNPRQVENTELVNQTRPFALLTAQILKRLGGEYVRFADEMAIFDHLDNCKQKDSTSNSRPLNFFAYDDAWVGRDNLIQELSDRVRASCRLLVLLGITGIGKTALGERIAVELTDWFDEDWSNFHQENFDDEHQSSDFASVAARWMEKWGEVITPDDRKDPQRLLYRLIAYLEENRRLIQMDSLENILEGNEEENWNSFKDEWWIKFFESYLKADSCQSFIILTSEDLPGQLEDVGRRSQKFWYCQPLSGLDKLEQIELFNKTGLDVSEASDAKPYLERIGNAYEGHPLALRVIADEIKNKPFEGNVVAYWRKYGNNEVEEVEKAIAESQEGVSVGALRRNLRSRLNKTFARLKEDAKWAYILLCKASVYRCAVPEDFWLSHLEDLGRDKVEQKAALDALRERYLVEEVIENDRYLLRQHNLIRSVSLEQLKIMDEVEISS